MSRQYTRLSPRTRVQTPRRVMPAGRGNRVSDTRDYATRSRFPSVEEARQRMQEKYAQEARVAEEKKRQKEQKKREEWLKRQEALVRPGYVLGGERPVVQRNLQRDIVETDNEPDPAAAIRVQLQEEYNALVQQRIERRNDDIELQRNIQRKLHEERKIGQRNDTQSGHVLGHASTSGVRSSASHSATTSQASANPLYFLGTGYGSTSNPNVTGSSAAGTGNTNERKVEKPAGHVLQATASGASSESGNEEVDHRQQMLAARRRLQEQYDAKIQQAAKEKEEEEENLAKDLGNASLT